MIAGAAVHAAFFAVCFARYGGVTPIALECHVPDDAYYFAQIARNVAAGVGSCFSPGEPTNGYHPLWMLIVAALQVVLRMSTPVQPLVMFILGAALAIASVVPLTALLRTLGMPDSRVRITGLVYVVNPWMLCLVVSGMETGLFLLLFFGTFAVLARVLSSGRRSLPDAFGFGAMAGLLMLCRTDSVFYVGSALVYMALRRDRSWRWILTAGATAALFVLPWLVWSHATFGTIEQSSSNAIGFINQEHSRGLLSSRARIGTGLLAQTTFRTALYPLWFVGERPDPPAVAWLVAVALALSVHPLLSRRWSGLRVGWPPYLVLPLAALLAYFAFLRHFMQVWHTSLLIAMCAVTLATYVHLLGARVRVAVVLLLAILSVGTAGTGFYSETHGGIDRMQRMAVGAPYMLGHTDCGRFGFFLADRHEVVNLDGVVNNGVLRYNRMGRLSEYLLEKGIERVWSVPARFEFYNRHMTSVRMLRTPPPTNDRRVRGVVDLVTRGDPRGGTAQVKVLGWVIADGVDSGASLPIADFLDDSGRSLAVYRGKRLHRPGLIRGVGGFGAQFGGCEVSVPIEELPPSVRSVRLGVLTHDHVRWAPRSWPLGEDRATPDAANAPVEASANRTGDAGERRTPR
ncbi:MAG: hypothetical protein AB7O97_10730 [Planctomycetota bacterium]